VIKVIYKRGWELIVSSIFMLMVMISWERRFLVIFLLRIYHMAMFSNNIFYFIFGSQPLEIPPTLYCNGDHKHGRKKQILKNSANKCKI